MKHVISLSGGIGSYAAARRVVEGAQPGDDVVLLFADTKIEDADLYRFLQDTVRYLGLRTPYGVAFSYQEIRDGRDVWEVFYSERFLGNSRIDPCSKFLKRVPIRRWIDANCDPADTVVYLGIDWTEEHRFTKAVPYWAPFTVKAPLCEPPTYDRDRALEELRAEGIEPPRLYAMGFPHNNCGGFCVKAGQASFRLLLEKMPDRYAEHERREQDFREFLGKDVAILTDRRGGGRRPLTLREFRERIEAESIEIDPYDLGGCACFTPDDYEADAAEAVLLPMPTVPTKGESA